MKFNWRASLQITLILLIVLLLSTFDGFMFEWHVCIGALFLIAEVATIIVAAGFYLENEK